MKKKILSIALVVCLLATALVSGTLAYFTDKDENNNVFTMGNVDIELDEAKVERVDDEWTRGNERVEENKYEDIFPGAVLPKDPTVHNVGSYGAYVRVKVSIANGMTMLPLYAEDDTLTDELYDNCFLAMIGGKLGEGWKITDGITKAEAWDKVMKGDTTAEFVITYNAEVASKDSTTAVFEKIVIPADWTQDDLRVSTIQEYGFEMDIVAEAIQADGFADVTTAFAAY